MKKSIRATAAAMLIPILLTLTGCSLTVDGVMSVIAPTETPVPGSDLVFSDAPEVTPEPRQIAYEKWTACSAHSLPRRTATRLSPK